jgi:hypothetical protein
MDSGLPNDVLVPISIGDLIDKITILEIKADRIRNAAQLDNIRRELASLRGVASRIGDRVNLDYACTALKRINAALWDAEDAIRACEARDDFGRDFVEIARSIYRLNDERALLKRALNTATRSALIEEKSYAIPRAEPDAGAVPGARRIDTGWNDANSGG